MATSIKDFLYAWLGKNKKVYPQYNTSGMNRQGAQRFKCELRVPGFSYTGLGNSQNKNDAATNAAIDFTNYLVREGHVQQNEVPMLTASSLEATSAAPMPFGSCFGDGPPQPNSFKPDPGTPQTGNGGGYGASDWAPQENQQSFQVQRTQHENYINQKAEEMAKSESVDFRADLHGGWTIENSKQAVNEFLAKLKMPAISYAPRKMEGGMSSTFICEVTQRLPQLNTVITGRGQGSTKKVAESQCAANVMRQLFHKGLVKAFSGNRVKRNASNLPSLPIPEDPELFERVKAYINKRELQPVKADLASTPELPQSLLIDTKLAAFEEVEAFPGGNISWCPATQNWNPWRACNIDAPPLAFQSLQQISQDLAQEEQQKSLDARIQETRQHLPVYGYYDQLIATIEQNQVTLIKGETGCGKSTQVPQYLLEHYIREGRGAEFAAFVSQPRRISAISLCERVAAERGEQPGYSIGYSVRFDGVTPRPYGAIMFCTVGVLLRRMESGLRGVSHVFIDEIHERDINTDFVLVVLREMAKEHRGVRFVLMSATIDTEMFQNFFGNCPVIEMEGRTFPVQQFFLEDIIKNLNFMPDRSSRAVMADEEGGEEADPGDTASKNLLLQIGPEYPPFVRQAMQNMSEREVPYQVIEAILTDIDQRGVEGSVLIFLPGWQEIQFVMTGLQQSPIFGNSQKYLVLPLHSQVSSFEQRKVFDRYPGQRKIILSTNIAETSVTIDDVVFVIDSCKAREKMYTSHNNMVHFATVWASKTNLAQRRGRAGRVRDGYAFHLCTKARYEALEQHRMAEMLRTPLHEIALTIKLLNLGSIGDFLAKAIEPPPVDTVIEAEVVLREMNALDRHSELTPLGRIIARMPVDPVMGRTIVLGCAMGVGAPMCDVAAASSFSAPWVFPIKERSRLTGAQRSFAGARWSDHIGLLGLCHAYRGAMEGGPQGERQFCDRYSVSGPILKQCTGAKQQLVEILINQCGFPEDVMWDPELNMNGEDANIDLILALLVQSIYPNVGYYKGKRKICTLEQATALLTKQSILSPFKGEDVALPSPLLIFTEKLRTKCISCKNLSVITGIQLLLFGARRVECVGEDAVRIDDMIHLRMNPEHAAAILALRPCVEALLIDACMEPSSVATLSEVNAELVDIIRCLCSQKFLASPDAPKDNILADCVTEATAQRGMSRPSGGYRGGPPGGGYRGRGGGFNSGGGFNRGGSDGFRGAGRGLRGGQQSFGGGGDGFRGSSRGFRGGQQSFGSGSGNGFSGGSSQGFANGNGSSFGGGGYQPYGGPRGGAGSGFNSGPRGGGSRGFNSAPRGGGGGGWF
ncbi:unnamed protein product, partial [Mesorhabditis spiculigera]